VLGHHQTFWRCVSLRRKPCNRRTSARQLDRDARPKARESTWRSRPDMTHLTPPRHSCRRRPAEEGRRPGRNLPMRAA
jgi:hypothetical protein